VESLAATNYSSGKCFSSGRRDSASCNKQRRLLFCGWTFDRCRRSSAATARDLPQSTSAPPLAPFRGWRCLITSLIASLSGEVLLLGTETCSATASPRRPLTPAPPSHIAHPSPRVLCNRAPPCKLQSTYVRTVQPWPPNFTSARHRIESLNALLHY
jgi:hypothetical protein